MSSEFDWILQKAMGMGSIILLLMLLLAFGCLCHSVISLCCVWLKTYCNWAEEKKKSPSPEEKKKSPSPEEKMKSDIVPNIFFQNARFSGKAPPPERLPVSQRLPKSIWFFVRVSSQDGQVSLVKPLPERIKKMMHLATIRPGHELSLIHI